MEQTYLERKRADRSAPSKIEPVPASPSLDALQAGVAQPTQEQLGRPVDLPGAIQAKMEAAFGADLSAVKLYESQAVADAGAQAVAQGSRIAFAPGKLDFASSSGQALLGHELSHVISQARGEVTGSGFLRDAALEARADREGAMAATGESVYAGPVTTALSTASAAPAAGPMQASKAITKSKKHFDRIQDAESKLADRGISEGDRKRYEKQRASGEKWLHYWEKQIDPDDALQERGNYQDQSEFYHFLELHAFRFKDQYPSIDFRKAGKINEDRNIFMFWNDNLQRNQAYRSKNAWKINQEIRSKFSGGAGDDEKYLENSYSNDLKNNSGRFFSGLGIQRTNALLAGSAGSGLSRDDMLLLFERLMAPREKNSVLDSAQRDQKFDEGIMQLKGIYFNQLKRLRDNYGIKLTQMHPEDVLRQIGPEFFSQFLLLQSTKKLIEHQSAGDYFDFEHNADDQEFKRLSEYYNNIQYLFSDYALNRDSITEMQKKSNSDRGLDPKEQSYLETLMTSFESQSTLPAARGQENGIGGPRLDEEELEQYRQDLAKRVREKKFKGFLFGDFKNIVPGE